MFNSYSSAPKTPPTATFEDPNANIFSSVPAAQVDLTNVTIDISPGLTNVRLADVLDAIVQVADQPIGYRIEDYGVVFLPKGSAIAALYTRTYKVDPKAFVEKLKIALPDRANDMEARPGRSGELSIDASVTPRSYGPQFDAPRSNGPQIDDPRSYEPQLGSRFGYGFTTRTNQMASVNQSVREFFASEGVDFGGRHTVDSVPNGKAIFFNDRTGLLLVRATLEDLEIISAAVEKLNVIPFPTNEKKKSPTTAEPQTKQLESKAASDPGKPAQVAIETKFVEIGEATMKKLGSDWFTAKAIYSTTNVKTFDVFVNGAKFPSAETAENSSASQPGVVAIFTEARFPGVFKAMKEFEQIEILAGPQVTTLSGRQAEISVADMKSVGFEASLKTNGKKAQRESQTTKMPVGPTLNVVSSVSADGFSIQLALIQTLNELVDYTDPDKIVAQAQSLDGANIGSLLNSQLPMPNIRIRSRQVVANCTVWDGQTVMLALGDQSKSMPNRKRFFVFVTAKIVDSTGARVHSEKDLESTTNAVPRQSEQK